MTIEQSAPLQAISAASAIAGAQAKTMIRATILALTAMALFCAAPSAAKERYGAQLYTVRAEMERDFEGTLRRIAEIGYTDVEFAGLFGQDPAEVRRMLKDLGLKAAASHVDWKRIRSDPDALIAETRKLGSRYMVLAWMPPEERQTLQHWRNWVTDINRVAAKARKAGLRFAYHAHDFEFHTIDGVRPIDLLLEETDPKLVEFEIDVYWTVKGGDDPLALLARYPQRFPLAHLKDMARESGAMADLGDGRIDFPTFLRAARKAGLKHAFVERDDAANPFQTLERSLVYWKSITGRQKK